VLAVRIRIRYKILDMADCTGLPNKKDVARALLLKGTVFVHLDPRCEDVVVPPWLRRQPQLVLQVGLDMRPVPIPDLRIDEAGVYATLSFNRNAFTCAVPWDAVFAVVGDDGRGMVWPASMPKEIAAEVEREAHRARIATPSEDGTVQELSPQKRRRRATPTGEKPTIAKGKAPTPVRVARGARMPRLQLIAGDGPGAAPSRGERRATPPHLRLVK
jgi:hypothetical protein